MSSHTHRDTHTHTHTHTHARTPTKHKFEVQLEQHERVLKQLGEELRWMDETAVAKRNEVRVRVSSQT